MYESFYGLQTKPFSLLPDPGFLYMGKKHKVALALLEYALMNNAGFCVITGEIGAGKTTLLRKLLENIEDNITVGMITNTHQSFGELLDWVLSAFGIHESGLSKVEMHQRLVDFLLEQYANNKSTLLIVDEAQNMPAATLEELRMLSNINSEKDLVLQIILSGQPGLRDTLRKPELLQFVQRISVDYHLDALSIDESCAYIQHRLVTAGAETDVFTPEACRLIHAYSDGIPRLINLLADTALVYAFADQKQMVGADIIEEMVSERMENSILPLAEVDSESSTATTDDSGFPWISPDGGNQGLKPVAEKKTAEKVVTSINKQDRTAKPAQSAEPVEAPKKSKSVTRPEKLDAAEPAPGDDASLEAAEDTIEAGAHNKDVAADDSRTKPAADANEKRVADSPPQGDPSPDSPDDIPQLAEEQAIVVDQAAGTAPGDKPRKSRNKTRVIASLLVFVVAALIFVSAGSLYSGKELKSEVKSKMAEVEKIKRDMERIQSEAEILQRERDAALARAQQEEAQRAQEAQAAIEAAAREREAMAAAALAAEQALQAKKEAEELAKQQRLKEKRLREERERLQMEKKQAELEQQRLEQERRQAELEKQRLALEKAEREKLAQQEREKRIAREQAELFESMEAAAAAKAEEVKKAKSTTAKKESSFSTDPCSSPSAKFLSTCR